MTGRYSVQNQSPDPRSPRRSGIWRDALRTLLMLPVALLALGGLFAATAFAAGLGGLSAGDLGAGGTPIRACDDDGFTYDLTLSTGLVTAVVVGDISDPGCEEGTLHLTLVDANGDDIGSGTTAIGVDSDTDANLVTVSLSVQPLLTNVEGIHAAVVGP